MSQINNYNYHIHGWLEKIESNIQKLKQQEFTTVQEKIDFLSYQYYLMMLISRALAKQTIFTGAKQIENL